MESGTDVSVFACGADYTQRFTIRASVRQIRVAPQRLVPWRKLGIEYAIGRARHLRHLGDLVDADDVRTVEDARRNRRGRSPDAFFGGRGLAIARQSRSKEALARCANHQRMAELGQLSKFL